MYNLSTTYSENLSRFQDSQCKQSMAYEMIIHVRSANMGCCNVSSYTYNICSQYGK